MNLRKKALARFVSLFLISVLVFAAGCSNKGAGEPKAVSSNTITITDMAGRTVVVPDKVEKIATPNVDAYRIILHLGAQDKLVGVPSNMYNSKFSKQEPVDVLAWPGVKDVTKVGGGSPGTEINVESILSLEPDVIITWSYGKGKDKRMPAVQAEQLQEKTGKPVICLNTIDMDGTDFETIKEAYTIMGKLLDREERAQELINYYSDEVSKVTEVVKGIPAEKRAKAYMANTTGFLRAAEEYLPFVQLELENVAKSLGKRGGDVSKEQMVSWNPDIIFLHTPSKVRRVNMEEVVNDKVLGNLDAIKQKKYYNVKATYMGWDVSTGLVDLYYMAKLSYPEYFKDLDVEKKGEEILKKFYGVDGLYERLATNSDFQRF